MSAELSAPRIAVLPEVVKNQIAAGEVVERPASVVKELLENALDAGAADVRVDLEEGGVKLVRVTDDGSGMSPADLELAFASHATSKLTGVGDLEHIASLGFRGEALSSIGSVARCRIFSRTAGADVGWQVENEGGAIRPPREAGGAYGTVVEVRDLFYNTPARRKFLKRDRTELARCLDWIQRLALAHANVAVTANHGGKRLFDVGADMDLRARIRRTYDAELADALVPVHATDGTTELSGFVAPPRFARRDTARQMWFLNGRFLRDKVLIRCLKDAYHGFLDGPLHPVAFLSLAMDPARVDVNVHPTKSEVRFRDERRLFGFLRNALASAVRETDAATPGGRLLATLERRGEWTPPAQGTLPDPRQEPGSPPARGGGGGGEPLVLREVPGRPLVPPLEDAPGAQASPSPAETGDDGWSARDELAGPYVVVDRTYIVRSTPQGLEIVDQHALHERLTFEELRADLARGGLEVQRFLVPELVEVDRADVALASDGAEALAGIGIEVDVFGPTTLAVHGLPARLRRPNAQAIVEGALASLRERGDAPELSDLLEDVLHRTACRSSVMAGDELSESEIHALLTRAREIGHDQTCPHGRPTRVRFALADLERAFHRR